MAEIIKWKGALGGVTGDGDQLLKPQCKAIQAHRLALTLRSPHVIVLASRCSSMGGLHNLELIKLRVSACVVSYWPVSLVISFLLACWWAAYRTLLNGSRRANLCAAGPSVQHQSF
jgi:hypothetical protein